MNTIRDDYESECICRDPQTLVIDRKSVGRIVSLLLVFLFFVFISGYFLGKRTAVKEFVGKIEQEAFADQVSLALNSMYDYNGAQEAAEDQSTADQPESAVVAKTDQVDADGHESMPTAGPKEYRAELLGGNSKTIQTFIDRLAQRGITVEPRKRTGKTPKGRAITWHQAVSPGFSSKDALTAYLEKIQETEKISGIRIVEIV